MKLICDGNALSDAILKVSKALPNKTVTPILDGIKLTAQNDVVTLFATDTELAIEKKINADVLVEGEIVVPGRLFNDFVRKLANEQLELSTMDNQQLKIKYTDSETTIACLNSDDYPVYEKLQNAQSFCLMQNELKELINKTIFAVSKDDARPILKGCLVEAEDLTISCVASDGYRLAKVNKPLEKKCDKLSIIVPSRALNELGKILSDNELVTVYIEKNYLLADLGDITLSTRLLSGQFINYQQIFPAQSSTHIIVNKQLLENALDRAGLLSRTEKSNLIKMEIKESTLHIQSSSEYGNVSENISISLKGKDVVIAFNASYISDCVKVISSEFLTIDITSSVAPAIIKEMDNDNSLFLVLPVRTLN